MADARWSLHFAWGRPPYALDLPEVVIGRADDCTLQIDEPAAAATHARFVVDDDERVWLEDLGSGKPTLVNGRAIADRTELTDGDFVQIGHSVLTVRQRRADPTPGPFATAAPDTRTMQATELPEAVRRLLEQAESARNVVVGEGAPDAMPTLMMDSPLPSPGPRPREAQPTVEVKADAILSSTRRDPPLPEAPSPVVRAAPAPQMSTLIGIGAADLPAAPTAIAPTPSRARNTATDLTPLPAAAPTPPPSPNSIADLQPLVNALTSRAGEIKTAPNAAPPLSALKTQQLVPAVGVDAHQLGFEKTQLPTEVPAEVTAAVAARQAQATHVGSLHAMKTQTAVPVREPALHDAKTQAPMPIPAALADAIEETARTRAAPTTVPDRAAPATQPITAESYSPPSRGPFGSFSRAIDFFGQMFTLARKERALLRPFWLDLAIATPISLAFAALMLVVSSPGALYAILCVGTAALYFVDYFCNALTASLLYDYVTTGQVDVPAAGRRVRRGLSGIFVFAAVSALLDVATTYARERRDLVSRLLLRVLHAIWTTATYVIMPAMIIEGVSFKDAFARSKKLMDQDPTGVGAGVVALSLVSYLCAAVLFPLAYVLMRVGSAVHPVLGAALFFTVVNLYWAASGWMKIAYSTCFYLWAQRCEAEGRADAELAPLPLRHAIDAG